MLVFANGGRIRLEETGRIVDTIRDTVRDAEAVFETLMRGVHDAFQNHLKPVGPGSADEAGHATDAANAPGELDALQPDPEDGEDWPGTVQLDLAGAPINLNGALVLASRLIGVPDGSTLSHGANIGGGVWDVDPSGLGVLQIAPPWGHEEPIDLKLELAVTHRHGAEGDHRDFTIVIIPVPVMPAGGSEEDTIVPEPLPFEVGLPSIADAPGLPSAVAMDVSGSMGAPLLLGGRDAETGEPLLSGAPPDGIDAAYMHFLLSGVPDGAALSSGYPCGDGTWIVAQEQLPGLMFHPPRGLAGRLDLIFTAVVLDPEGRVLTRDARFTVSVSEADGMAASAYEAAAVKPYRERLPAGTLPSATGVPGRQIRLDLPALDEPDLDAVVISGLPPGARLRGAQRDDAGLYAVPRDGLDAVSVIPSPEQGDFRLKVTSTDIHGDVLVDTLTVNVVPVRAHVEILPVAQKDGGGIGLSVRAETGDPETELRGVVIGDLPPGTAISAGFYNPRTGNWVMSLAAAADVVLRPPPDCEDDISITIRAVAVERTGRTVSDTRRVRLRRAVESRRPQAPVAEDDAELENLDEPEPIAEPAEPVAAEPMPVAEAALEPELEPEPVLESGPGQIPEPEPEPAIELEPVAALEPDPPVPENRDSCTISVSRPANGPAGGDEAGNGSMTGARSKLSDFAGRNGHGAASFTDDEDPADPPLRRAVIGGGILAQRATP